MKFSIDSIKIIDLTKADESSFHKRFVGCLVLTNNNKILLQQRGNDWDRFPGYLATFGGRIELEETAPQALVRELKEELGANVILSDVISLGAIAESYANHSELVHTYFWHDKYNTITGCYEGKPKYYDSYTDALTHPKIMDDVRWIINESLTRGLIQAYKN